MVTARAEAINFLDIQGRLPSNYAIVDINRYVEGMGVRNRVLLYSVWLYIAFLLLKWGKLKGGKLKLGKKSVLVMLPGALIGLAVMAGIIDILFWLPSLSDMNVSIFASISNIGVLPTEMQLAYGLERINLLNRYANYIWVMGMAGLVNVSFFI